MAKKKEPTAMVIIGTSPEAVEAVEKAILAILKVPREEETIRKALDVLDRTCKVKNVTIQNCTFTVGERPK